MENKEFHIDEELLIVRHSGEIPEVALHGSIYFMTEDPEGPAMRLDRKDLDRLREMAAARYREIIRRDITSENRDKGLYRGLARCIANWHRYQKFCRSAGLEDNGFRRELVGSLRQFLNNEIMEVTSGRRKSCINCSSRELAAFFCELGILPEQQPAGWQQLCRE